MWGAPSIMNVGRPCQVCTLVTGPGTANTATAGTIKASMAPSIRAAARPQYPGRIAKEIRPVALSKSVPKADVLLSPGPAPRGALCVALAAAPRPSPLYRKTFTLSTHFLLVASGVAPQTTLSRAVLAPRARGPCRASHAALPDEGTLVDAWSHRRGLRGAYWQRGASLGARRRPDLRLFGDAGKDRACIRKTFTL